MHICPTEIGAAMIVLQSIGPYASAFWYTEVVPFFERLTND